MANQLLTNAYGSTNVTTSAYVQLTAATTLSTTQFLVTDTSGALVKLAIGGTPVAAVAATATLATTTPITLKSVAAGTARNTTTFTTVVNVADANPTNTILAAFTGTSAAITCTITPNDGTHNGAVPVNMTTAQLRELITTGAVAGKTVTITDASSFRILQTATGGGSENLANSGEGDGVVGTFAGGVAATTTGEVDLFQLPVSGTAVIPIESVSLIPIGSRLSLKAISGTASSGFVAVTLIS